MRVERRKRLVEEEQRRVAGEGTRESHPLSLAAGELGNTRPGERTDAEPLEQQLDVLVPPRAEADVVPNVEMREECVLLEEVADATSLRRDVGALRRVQEHLVVECDVALVRTQEPRDDAKHRRLPRTGRPDERDGLAALDRQVGRRAVAAKGVSEPNPERHRLMSLTESRTSALVRMRSALTARATSMSRSSCS
jgi:hypothetical protein